MKKTYTLLAIVTLSLTLLLPQYANAQSPDKISYQAVVRNASNLLVTYTEVGMQISILQGSVTGIAVYVETHIPITNANGLVTFKIGDGTVLSGDFTAIDWTDGPYFIKTETDLDGGNNYAITGTSQLLSVPYALHARTADSIVNGGNEIDPIFSESVAFGITETDTTNWNNKLDAEVDGDITNELQLIDITDNTIWLTDGGSADLPPETDPIFNISVASGITATDTAYWFVHTDSAAIANMGYIAFTSLSTSPAGQITISANGGTSPDPAAILDLQSTDKGFLPPRMTRLEREAIASPAAGLMIFNTDDNTWQGYNGTVWENLNGTSCAPPAPAAITGSDQVDENATGESYTIAAVPGANSYHWTVPDGATIVSGQNTTSITVDFADSSGNVSVRAGNDCGYSSFTDLAVLVGLSIGNFYEGGVVFYLDGSGGGLICAVSDQSSGTEWGCPGTDIPGAEGTAIGTGAQNTIDIEAGCATPGVAADVCANLLLNGYDNWFLPSKDELNEMHLNKAAINATATANGGTAFVSANYWSSSESNEINAWRQYFGGGSQDGNYKNFTFRVRAVRAF